MGFSKPFLNGLPTCKESSDKIDKSNELYMPYLGFARLRNNVAALERDAMVNGNARCDLVATRAYIWTFKRVLTTYHVMNARLGHRQQEKLGHRQQERLGYRQQERQGYRQQERLLKVRLWGTTTNTHIFHHRLKTTTLLL